MAACAQHLLCPLGHRLTNALVSPLHAPAALAGQQEGVGRGSWSEPTCELHYLETGMSQPTRCSLWIPRAGADSRFQQAVVALLGDIAHCGILKPQKRSLLLLNLPWSIPQKEQSLCHVASISICYICCWMAFVQPARDCVLLWLLTGKHQILAPTWSQTQVKVFSSLSKLATQSEAC